MMDEQTQDLDDLTPETETAASQDAPEALEAAEAPEGALESPTGDVDGAPVSTEEEAPVRPREIIKGIHPELKCECPECAPEFTELQWFSPEEEKKTKGQVMLYCQRSSRKYFSPATEFQTWVAENKVTGKKRRD